MNNYNKLSYKDLKLICNPNVFTFQTTADLDSSNQGVLGQERGLRALEFGLNVDIKGYNMYLEGPTGVGKTMYTKHYLDIVSKRKAPPFDWCYIYNFQEPNEPVAVSFPAGKGLEFKKLMDLFIEEIKKDLKTAFNNKDFEKEKTLIKQEFEEKRNILIEQLNEQTTKKGFQVKASQNGIYMLPIIDGKTINEEAFNNLEPEIKKQFEEQSNQVQEQILEAIGQIKAIERDSDQRIHDWQSNIALLTINVHINTLKNQYKRNKKLTTFIDGMKQDILKNIKHFIVAESDPNSKQPSAPTDPRLAPPAPWQNYRVNLFIDNSESNGVPVIMDSNYSYQNLFGKLEYENQYGMLKTDYTMLKPGLLHKANGGYILLQAKDLLQNPYAYECLKKALSIRQLHIENAIDQRTSMVMISLKPEPIPLDVKVLLIGNDMIYQTLLAQDSDFKKLFKVKVEFEEETSLTEENMLKLAKFVHNFCNKEDMLELTPEAMAKIIEYSSKIANDKNKLSTRFNLIAEIVGEAATWAKMDKESVVNVDYINRALFERRERIKKFDKRYIEMIQNDTLLINTTDKVVGQINGLTVMSIGDYSFGKPTKITANTYIGQSGIVNVERETSMSGSSHNKGLLILEGYIGQVFAQDFPLSLSASLCFEQLYNGVDGDSASSTEAYALLSSLANIPIKQSIAVTGSVNQKGQIQPIGGVNDKIEGFHQICKMRGLTGEHGVIIPIQNVMHLNLSDEVVEDVKNGLFNIYAIETIEEGIEILTGVPAGRKLPDGTFPLGSVNHLAYEKLKKFATIANQYTHK